MVRNLLTRSSWLFMGSLLGKIATTAIFVLLARALSPQYFGQLSLFLTIQLIVTVVADFGLNQWYQKKIHLSKSNTPFFNSLVSARLITLFFSLVSLTFFLVITKMFSPFVSICLLLSLLPEAFLSCCDGFYLAKKQVWQIALKPSSKVLIILIGYLLLSTHLTFDWVVILLTLGSFITFAWFFPWKNYLKYFEFKFITGWLTLKESRPYALLTLTSLVYARADALVIQNSLGNVALGLYASAYRYLESLSLLPNALNQNLFSHAAKKEGLPLQSLLKISLLMILAGGFFAFVTFVFAPFLIVSLLGAAYQPAVPVLRILSGTLFLFFVNAPLSTVVQSSTFIKKFLPFGIANTLLNILLNLAIIPTYGIFGAAVVMTISEATGLLINLYFIRQIYQRKL